MVANETSDAPATEGPPEEPHAVLPDETSWSQTSLGIRPAAVISLASAEPLPAA